MTRFYVLDDANAILEEIEPIMLALREQRMQLIQLRDQVLRAEAAGEVEPGGSSGPADDSGGPRHQGSPGDETGAVGDSPEELRLVRLRMQGLIDQMQAGVARLDALGIVLRDIESGLVDFPALVNGRQVWLCWRLGEREVGWWHELSTGVAGRQPIAELI